MDLSENETCTITNQSNSTNSSSIQSLSNSLLIVDLDNSHNNVSPKHEIVVPRLIVTPSSQNNIDKLINDDDDNDEIPPNYNDVGTRNNNNVPETVPIPIPNELSKLQIRFIIVLLVICNFCIANGVSLQGPFFPKEAESKGATPIIYSSIFAIYELVMLITSFIFGNLVDRFRPNLMSGFGLTITGLSTTAFGLLTYWYGPLYAFVLIAFALRIVESLGATAFATSSYSFISACFPDQTATMFATMEMAFGLGVISGPVVGGFLYDWGGFLMPFIVIGGIMSVCGLTLISGPVKRLFTLGKQIGQLKSNQLSLADSIGQQTSFLDNRQPSHNDIEDSGITVESIDHSNLLTVPINEECVLEYIDESNTFLSTSNQTTQPPIHRVTLSLFLSSPVIVVDSFIIITAITLMGFNGATLEPFLRHHDITTSTLYASLMFVALGASYAFTAILWGKACDRYPNRLIQFSIVGAAMTVIGLTLIGPIPLLSTQFQPTLWSISGCLILFGIGTAAKQVAGYTHAMNFTIQRRKFPPNQQTYGYISGMFFSCLSFGGFIGPIIGGSLVENFNYPFATMVMLVIEIFVMLILLALQCCCPLFRI